jgi:predicted DNA repair protein MutK
MKTQTAIVVVTLIIVSVLAIAMRWEVSGVQGGIVRLDRWTGAVTQCHVKVITTQCE